MQEMVYENKRNVPSIVLDKGYYKGYEYVILSLHIHPCAYICLTPNSVFYGKSYDSIHRMVEHIDCNGGLTYSEHHLRNFLEYSDKYKCDVKTSRNDKWFIGWDYGHFNDYSAIFGGSGKKWKTEEILEEVKQVIDELSEYEVI